MPYLVEGAEEGVNRLESAGQLTAREADQGFNIVSKNDHNWLATAGGMLAFGAVDLMDTVASSIPGLSRLAGFKRGDVNESMLRALDMPGLTDFYRDYQGGIEATSGIMGVVASEMLTRKLTAPAGAAMKAISKVPYARRLTTLDAEYASAMGTVRNVDRALAQRGALGPEQFVGRVGLDEVSMNMRLPGSPASPLTLGRKEAWTNTRILGFAKGARNAVVTEAIMGATLNQNGFLYDDDAAHNLMWMGLGVGIGGAVDALHATYKMRKFVNSDEIRRAYAGALDPDRTEEARLLWKNKTVNLPAEEMEAFGFSGGAYSDEVTSLLVSGKNLSDTPLGNDAAGMALASNREKMATQNLQRAEETIQKITTKGISTQGKTRFDMQARGYGNHVSLLNKRDAGWAYGLESLGGVPEDMSIIGIHESHVARLDERLRQMQDIVENPGPKITDEEIAAAQQIIKKIEWEKTQTPVAIIDGEKATLSDAMAFDNWVEPKDIRASKVDKETTLWETATDGRGGIGIDSNLTIHMPKNVALEKADHFDMLRLYRVADRVIDAAANAGRMIVPAKPTWFQLDMAEAAIRRNEGMEIQWPKGMNRESALKESLIQKAMAIKNESQLDTIKKIDKSRKGKPDYSPGEKLSRMRIKYNLPKITAYERGVLGETEHPIMGLLRGMGDYGADELQKFSVAELQEGMATVKRLGDIQPVAAKDMDLQGNSFKFLQDEKGHTIRPLIGYYRPIKPQEWTKDNIAERLAAKKLFVVAKMTAPDASLVTRSLAGQILSSPDFDVAARTHELAETQIQGSIAGAATQSPFGALGKAVTSREQRDRDAPIMLAAGRLQQMVSTFMRGELKAASEAAFGDTLAHLNSPRNAATKMLLNQFHTYRGGWDLAVNSKTKQVDFVVRTAPDGKKLHVPLLERSEKNLKRFQQFYGREMPAGQTLLSPNQTEVVLDDMGLDIQNRFNLVTEALRLEKNTILRAQGMREIKALHMYTPPPSIEGKYVGFVMDMNNEIVPGGTIVAGTMEEFTRLKQKLSETDLLKKPGYVFRTRDEIQTFASIWDRAQMDMIDPGTTAIQGGKSSKGALQGFEIDMNAFDNALATVRDQWVTHGTDIVETLLKEQVNAAKARANISTGVTKNKAGFFRDVKYRGIHDLYLENLLGRSPLASSGSLAGRVYNTIEGTIDSFLTSAAPSVSRVFQATTDWINKRKAWDSSEAGRKDFDSLTQHLGDYMPFKSAAEFAQARGAGSMPKQLVDYMGATSRFTAAVTLRMFETAMPLMNLAGILNAMPAVIRHMTPRAGQSAEEFAALVGHSASIFNLPNGQSMGVLDMGKLASRAAKMAWSKESHPYYKELAKRGMLSQEVAEFQMQFGSIKTKGDWELRFFGDPSARSAIGKKGLIGSISVLTDKSEDFSRSYGTMLGLELAKELGIKTMDDQITFAHDVANKMIANYNPHNRPEIFQGAVGAPIGLFQSFIMNYYQRMFRYIETKDGRALATQMASQGALFGVTTVPGWGLAQKFFFEQEDDSDGLEADPIQSIQARYGQGLGDIMAGGVISNLPRLFGGEAVDLYSRGDTDVRLPVVSGMPPALNIALKIKDGIGQAIGLFTDANPNLSAMQIAEVLSNTIPNRPLAGAIETFMGAQNDTDRYGQLVSDTRSALEATYRVLGTRSMRQSKQIEAYYNNKSAMEQKSSQDDILNATTRAAIRDGDMDSVPLIAQKYLENGGDPRYFRRWLKNNIESATKTNAERQLEDVINDSDKMDMVARLLDAEVGIDADQATTEDYSESLKIESDFDSPATMIENQPQTESMFVTE